MKDKLTFKKYDGTVIKDVQDYVKDWVRENPYGTVTIGCDSQEHARFIKYAVSIVMHYRDKWGGGHGGHVISAVYTDHSKNMKMDVYTKLWGEAEITIAIAQLIGDIGVKPVIHLDYNSDEKEYSHVLYNQGLGVFKAMGYEAMGKPFAWAASHTADRVAKSGRKK
jgi:predicted RNase H-related nuclease YkuK (DUF458 family)